MNGKQYLETQMALITLGKRLEQLDLEDFLSAISKAESVGPILDPTLYRRAQDNLNAIRELAKSFLAAQVQFEIVKENVLKTNVAYLVETGNLPVMPKPEEEETSHARVNGTPKADDEPPPASSASSMDSMGIGSSSLGDPDYQPPEDF